VSRIVIGIPTRHKLHEIARTNAVGVTPKDKDRGYAAPYPAIRLPPISRFI